MGDMSQNERTFEQSEYVTNETTTPKDDDKFLLIVSKRGPCLIMQKVYYDLKAGNEVKITEAYDIITRNPDGSIKGRGIMGEKALNKLARFIQES